MEEVKEDSSQNCSDSEDSSSSHSSSPTEAEDIESDLESLEEHYYSDLRRYTVTLERAFSAHLNSQQLNNQEWNFQGGRGGIQRFLTLPTRGPWQRLCSLSGTLRRQMETLLQTYCIEIEVTCAQAREQDAFVRRMALHLTQYLAVFLSETITVLLQSSHTPCAWSSGWYECGAAHAKILGPGHLHRVAMCLQPAQGCERTRKAEAAHWVSEGCLSPPLRLPRNMAAESPRMLGLKPCLAVAVRLTPCLFGFRHLGCPWW